jgi:pimeloyl-ACP methyl ester carboxylesterase
MTYGPIEVPSLVLVHGHGTNATIWYPSASALASHHRVYAPDTVGYLGKSAGAVLRYNSDDHSCWMNEVFEQLGLASARVAGISEGVLQRFVLHWPFRSVWIALHSWRRQSYPGQMYDLFPAFVF